MVDSFPLVTIITPAYNRADYLAETIDSVLNQNYPNLEYIVLDDGSTDNTPAVLSRYTGKIFWSSHANMGETRTVNKALAMARGELVAIVNSDDPLLLGAIKVAVNFMQAHPDLLVGYPDWLKIGSNGETQSRVQVPEYDYLYMLRYHHCIVGPGAFIHRRAFELTGYRDPAFRYVADFDYWLRLGLHGAFARIPQYLATFRVHPHSASVASKGTAMADEHIRLMEKYFALSNLPAKVRRVRWEAFSSAHWVAADMCGNLKRAMIQHRLMAILFYPKRILRPFAHILGISNRAKVSRGREIVA